MPEAPGRVHHVAIVVRSIDEALAFHRDRLGLALESVVDIPTDGVRIAFLGVAETLLRLEIDGIELIDTSPRAGADGPVAFLHPRSCHGVLVELIEARAGPAWTSLNY